MALDRLNDISLKSINLTKSHAAQAQQSKDNFKEIQRYINNLLCRVNNAEDNPPTVTTELIKETVRTEMIKVVELSSTQVDGTTNVQDNGITVTRAASSFVIQTPDSVPVLFHNLRIKDSKKYATGYTITMDNSNQVTLHFKPFIKEDLEFLIFG